MASSKTETATPVANEFAVTIDGKDYTLKFTRAAIRWGESQGLDIMKFEQEPMTQMALLFATALHGGGTIMPVDKMVGLSDAYFDSCDEYESTLTKLVEMYSDVFRIRG